MSGDEQRIGDHRVICDYSGFKVWASETAMTWNGYRVHRRFIGQEASRHPQELVRGRPDNQGVKNPRPEPADVFLNPNGTIATGGDSFPLFFMGYR